MTFYSKLENFLPSPRALSWALQAGPYWCAIIWTHATSASPWFLVPMLHVFYTLTTLFLRQTYLVPRYLGSLWIQITTWQKKCSKDTFHLLDNNLGQDKKQCPVNLDCKENRVHQLKSAQVGDHPVGPILGPSHNALYNDLTIHSLEFPRNERNPQVPHW